MRRRVARKAGFRSARSGGSGFGGQAAGDLRFGAGDSRGASGTAVVERLAEGIEARSRGGAGLWTAGEELAGPGLLVVLARRSRAPEDRFGHGYREQEDQQSHSLFSYRQPGEKISGRGGKIPFRRVRPPAAGPQPATPWRRAGNQPI